MIWLALLFASVSLVLIILNVEPMWIQYIGFGISLCLFAMILLNNLFQTNKLKAWFKNKGSILTIIFFFGVANVVARYYENVFDFSIGIDYFKVLI